MNVRNLFRLCVIILSSLFLYQIAVQLYIYLLFLVVLCISYVLLEDKFTEFVPVDKKAVLITGCDTGFGHYLAEQLADRGLTVFAGVLNESSDGAKELRDKKLTNLSVIQLDVTNTEQIQKAVDEVKRVGQGLWAVVNNAGFDIPGELEMVDLNQYQKCADVNLWGQIRVIKAFLPFIRKTKGRIINVGSGRGRFAWPGGSVYHITKYGIETMSDCLRLEMAKFGVKVCIIEPGYFASATSMTSSAMCKRIESEIDLMWEKASPEVREVYGKKYFYSYHEGYLSYLSLPRQPDLAKPCVDAMEDAVLNTHPKTRYLVGGTYKICDPYAALARFYNYLPTFISDPYCNWFLSGNCQIQQKNKLH